MSLWGPHRSVVGHHRRGVIRAFLEPDWRAIGHQLSGLGLTAKEIEQVVAECYPESEVSATIASRAAATIALFRRNGVLDDRSRPGCLREVRFVRTDSASLRPEVLSSDTASFTCKSAGADISSARNVGSARLSGKRPVTPVCRSPEGLGRLPWRKSPDIQALPEGATIVADRGFNATGSQRTIRCSMVGRHHD